MEWWGFWWLIFPIGGAVFTWVRRAAAVRERSLDRRHQREIELIHARQLGGVPAAAAPVDAVGTPPATELERLFAAHDETTARWLEYELDVGKTIAFPAMSDGRQPLTAAFLRAKRVADRLRPDTATAHVAREQLREYRDAVTDYEVAFDLAERDARRLKDSEFTAAERKRLETAQRLLAVAVDEAATPAERQVAYRRVREELDGLLSLSDEAVEQLEKKVSLELPAQAPADSPSVTPATGADTPPPVTSPEPIRVAPRAVPLVPPRAAGPDASPRDTTAPGRVIRPKPGV